MRLTGERLGTDELRRAFAQQLVLLGEYELHVRS